MKKKSTLTLLSCFLLFAFTATQAQCPSKGGFTTIGAIGNDCYYVSTSNFTFSNAITNATTNGGILAVVTTSAEQAHVAGSTAMIGAHNPTGVGNWEWHNGEMWDYTNWNTGEPNGSANSYVYMMSWLGGAWDDNSKPGNRPYILEVTNSLPVELIRFSGEAEDDRVELQWATASELGNHGFDIERSSNGIDWETIKFVKGAGTSFETNYYKYSDTNPHTGYNFYRIKQIDLDGTQNYSYTINVEVAGREQQLFFSPNPSREGNTINLQINYDNFEPGTLTLYDLSGRVLMIQDVNSTQMDLDVSKLSKGLYFARLILGLKELVEQLLIK